MRFAALLIAIALIGPARANETPRRNFIDNFIFDKMRADGVSPAPLSSDSEFLRRVSLDLTGRLPSAPEASAQALMMSGVPRTGTPRSPATRRA